MKKIITLLTFALIAICGNIKAQDLIIKKNNEQLKVKIVEVGTKEIKFRFFDAPDGPIISMSKSEIKSIKIAGKNDVVLNMDDNPMSVSNNAIIDKTSALKFNFFSPLSDHLEFNYEWMQKPGFNWEVGLGIIGPGVSVTDAFYNSNPKGAYLRGGPKFLIGSTSDFEMEENARFAHPLKGRYIKIEAIANTFSKTFQVDTSSYWLGSTTSYVDVKNTYQSLAFNLIYGRQYIVGNAITIGYYLGCGFGFESKTSTLVSTNYYDDYTIQRYSHSYFGKDFPFVITSGFNIGYIFKTPAWLNSRTPMQNNKAPSRNSMN